MCLIFLSSVLLFLFLFKYKFLVCFLAFFLLLLVPLDALFSLSLIIFTRGRDNWGPVAGIFALRQTRKSG